MMIAALPFPNIDPIIFSIGPIAVRWYSLAYIVGLLFAIWLAKRIVANVALWGANKPTMKPEQIDDLLLWVMLGVIGGGRLGYVLLYKPSMLFNDPLQVLQPWDGGMSFHGGFLGVVIAFVLFARKHDLSMLQLFDLGGVSVPVGLGLGRLANFINGELYGRVSDVSWAMVFPTGGLSPRHPSQLYEFALEGVVLFIIAMLAIYKFKALEKRGLVAGLFVAGYGISRFIVEFAREPDAHIGYIGGWGTLGMIYSLPLIGAGLWLIMRDKTRI